MKKLHVVFVVLALLIAGPAYADLFGFYNISNNSGVAEALAGQLYVDVNPYEYGDPGEEIPGVLFDFYNGGSVPVIGQISDPIPAFINEIYFDFTTGIFTSGVLNVGNDGTVTYKFGADPANLPGGAPLGFNASLGIEPNGTEGINQNGIDINEKLGIFLTREDFDFDDVIEAIRSEEFRIGLHVKGIGTVRQSDSFINSPNPVPEPATILLLGTGLVGFAAARRKKKYFKK